MSNLRYIQIVCVNKCNTHMKHSVKEAYPVKHLSDKELRIVKARAKLLRNQTDDCKEPKCL